MNEKRIHPYWRAIVGAGFGVAIGTVTVFAHHHFWTFVFLLLMVILGAIAGVLLISGD